MKILLPLLLLPLLVQSQSIKVEKSDTLWSSAGYKFTVENVDTLPKTTTLEYYLNTPWYTHTTELIKGKVETPVNVMDSGMKVEVVETRDTIYKCPYSNFTYFTYDYNVDNTKVTKSENCKLDKIVTTRRYKLYIINEYGQKEYLSMELTKQK